MVHTSIEPIGRDFKWPDIHGGTASDDGEGYERLLPYIYPEDPLWRHIEFINARKDVSKIENGAPVQ